MEYQQLHDIEAGKINVMINSLIEIAHQLEIKMNELIP